jgi:Tfp pilus assembly protein PilW
MGRLRQAWVALRRSEAGMTLIELSVATMLGLLVIGVAATIVTTAVRSEPKATSKAAGVQQARVVMDRMTREIRQGLSVPTATSTQLSVVTYVDSATCGGAAATTAIVCRVNYTCTAGSCTRTVARPDGTAPGPARRVVSGLSSSAVFGYGIGSTCTTSATSPTYVCLSLAFPAKGGGNAITLRDGVALRNS